MPTISDFNNAVDKVADIARELDIVATDAVFDKESRDDGEGDHEVEILNVFFDHPEANPLTMNAEQ